MYLILCTAVVILVLADTTEALNSKHHEPVSRRNALTFVPTAIATNVLLPSIADAAQPNGLPLTTAPISGMKWADAKVGTGSAMQTGQTASIDFSMASTAGRFPQIYTTKDKGNPYRWKLGDGSTIRGIELAVLGSEKDGIPPMLPGGIRRVIVPADYGFVALKNAKSNAVCEAGQPGSIGPIPPKDSSGAYQRWYQFYCNPRIPYQPDLVLDIKLYGKR
ncbi:MAG: hypothetical protein SGILL_008046 [Bacillariaceae sp.]